MTIWLKTNGDLLNQGDLLRRIAIPSVLDSFPATDEAGNLPVNAIEADVIILSQSCDLELGKLPNVLVAQTFSVGEFEKKNPSYQTKGKWNHVLRGRVESLHLIASPENADDSKQHVVVDFRLLASLPFGYVQRVAKDGGDRWRLQSPYLEALAHAFGNFFSRVALPDSIDM
jgi:hypothetical protein